MVEVGREVVVVTEVGRLVVVVVAVGLSEREVLTVPVLRVVEVVRVYELPN